MKTLEELEFEALRELEFPDNYLYSDGGIDDLHIYVGLSGKGATDNDIEAFRFLLSEKLIANFKDEVIEWLENFNPDYSLMATTSNDSGVYKFICNVVKEKLKDC